MSKQVMPKPSRGSAKTKVFVYDTTLRDGTQGEDVSFSYEDKILIAKQLDELGIDYIEGGYPGSNPKDRKFFQEMKKVRLGRAKLVAFGMTMRAGAEDPAADLMLQTLVQAETPAVCIVGKSWDLHVTEALRITLAQNLDAVERSVRYLKSQGREVIFDAEHFFDGYKHNPEYAAAVLKAAADGGADWLILCDTNGGTMPWEIAQIVERLKGRFACPIGIHTHNDTENAVANTLAAVRAGATQVQGTVGGIGERCGNANLISVIANLQFKLDGYEALADGRLDKLTAATNFVMELANLPHPKNLPYVGSSAFAHKGGMHVSGVRRNPATYEHIDPTMVGNQRRILVSDLAGKATIVEKLQNYGLIVDEADARIQSLLDRLKDLEAQGYLYEGAEAIFELLVKRAFGVALPPYKLVSYRCLDERKAGQPPVTEATVVIEVDGVQEHTVAAGNGPVNALDAALRKGLTKFFPELEHVRLVDYKVRVLAAGVGTDAAVRVLIESTDGATYWGTVGVGTNIIDASYEALSDAIEYKLQQDASGNAHTQAETQVRGATAGNRANSG